jgi:CxxC motif-containing protein
VNTDGSFSEPSFESDPKTFITTVGLLNDANEMIAVAKTSQPIPKSFDKEVLIKVKLSF